MDVERRIMEGKRGRDRIKRVIKGERGRGGGETTREWERVI